MILSVATFFEDNLIEILLTAILSVNMAAWKLLWDEKEELKQKVEKNNESINMILNRIFGIDEDPTDEGHLVETEERFKGINTKLDEIAEGQKQMEKERKQEHEKVSSAIDSIIKQLSKEEKIDFEKDEVK